MALLLNGTDGVTFNDGSEQWAAASPIGPKNLIINGDMRIAQRGTSVTGLTTSGYNTVDRWTSRINSTGTWTETQDTNVPTGQGFGHSFKLQCTTANASLSASASMVLQYRLEGQMLQHLKKGTSNAESTTLSFWVKSNKTGTYIANLYDTDNARTISKAYTIDAADTWEKKTITYAGDTSGVFNNDNGRSLDLNLWLVAGTDYTSGTLMTTWQTATNADRAVGQVNLADSTSNYINITGVQLEVGDTATPFEVRPYDMELARCQRYYYTYANGASKGIGNSSNFTGTQGFTFINLKCSMRTKPSLDHTTGTNYYLNFSNTIADYFNNFNLWSEAHSEAVCIYADTNLSHTSGYSGMMTTSNASSYLAFNAEL